MRNGIRYALLALGLGVWGIALWGCAKPEASGGPGPVAGKAGLPMKSGAPAAEPREPQEARWVLGLSQCNLNEPWRVRMNKDIETAAAAHSKLQVLFKDAQNDATVQQNHVREFIEQGVDLIIISPKETKPLTAPVKEAFDQGIPVIVLDRRVEGDAYTCFIGGDNVKIGREAG